MVNILNLDVCKFTAASAGTGSFVVSAPVTGYQAPVTAGATTGGSFRYRAESLDLTQWEVGTGVYTSSNVTLTRTPIINSAAGSSAINFTNAPQVGMGMILKEDIGGTGQIVGTTTNDSATAGNIGEYVSATATSSNLTTASIANVTSVSLTAGDWDVGAQGINLNTNNPTVTDLYLVIAISSNTLTAAVGLAAHFRVAGTVDFQASLSIPAQRVSLSATTTYFVNTRGDFTGGTSLQMQANLFARRMR
jgi:hypothetical protein